MHKVHIKSQKHEQILQTVFSDFLFNYHYIFLTLFLSIQITFTIRKICVLKSTEEKLYNKFSPWSHLKCFSLGKKQNSFIYSKSSSLASLLEYASNPKAEKQ